jgi:2-methylaconitate cis-trans-isomerase PrpF
MQMLITQKHKYNFVKRELITTRIVATCSAAIGPFAVDEGLIPTPQNGRTLVRIFNTNTKKIIHAHFDIKDGKALVDGELVIPGVSRQWGASAARFS